MNKAEAQDLQKKAKKACMTEARLIRMLLEGYNPPVAPDDRFYDAMDEMRKASERLEGFAKAAASDAEREKYHNAAWRASSYSERARKEISSSPGE